MSKPVDKLDFWKWRIDHAKVEHYSVYEANDILMNKINKCHEGIIRELIGDEKVLDAGCAYGRSSVFFKPENYTGVDFSPDFIDIAKKKFPDYTFQVANLKELPYKDKEFKWSFCISIRNMVVSNLGEEEWQKMANELKRVSEKVLILEYGTFESKEDNKETISQYEILQS